MISEAGEDNIQRLTDALTDHGKEVLAMGKYTEAFEIGLAVLLVIEPELHLVSDEGATFQAIMDETINYLTSIAREGHLEGSLSLLRDLAVSHYSDRKESDSLYENDWLDLIELLGKE